MMKHPVLARVFAVVLAIMGLLLALSGVSGLRKNEADHAERLAFIEKYADRIEKYVSLREEVAGSASYEEAAKALSKLLDEHEKNAAKHKTDTALFSAEKGGYKMGEELIVSARVQLEQFRQELHDEQALRGLLEGVINQALAERRDSMPWLDAAVNSLLKGAGACYQESAKFTVAICELSALMASEPQLTDQIPKPEIPETPAEPGFPYAAFAAVSPVSGMGDYQQMYDAYAQAGAAYQQAMESYAAQWADYSEALYAYQSAMAQESAYQMTGEQYRQAHERWEQECRRVRCSVDFAAAAAAVSAQRPLADMLTGSVYGALAALLGPDFPGLDALAELITSSDRRLTEMARLDPASMTNEEFIEKATAAQDILSDLGEAYVAVASWLSNPGALIAKALQRLRVTDVLVQYLDSMLRRAEKEIQTQLENMWYMLGELDKDRVRLEAEKLGLDEEARLLRKRTVTTEELRELNDRCRSARQLVLSVPEVRAAVSEGADEEESARASLAAYERETDRLWHGRRLMNLLAAAGGVLGALGIPAAFEKIRGRFWLLAPVLLCLGLAGGAEGLSMYLGLGQMYAALFTAIFALLQLLIVLPKRKRPRYEARH